MGKIHDIEDITEVVKYLIMFSTCMVGSHAGKASIKTC